MLSDRLDSVRQKLTRARQLSCPGARQRLYTSILPLIVTSVGRGAQAGDLGVVADLQLQRLLGGAVDTRLEQERVAVRAHLVVDLLGVDRVEGCLNLADRHARIEDR